MTEIKLCPFCAEEININAIKCKHCGEMLEGYEKLTTSQNTPVQPPIPQVINVNVPEQKQRLWSPGVAGLLSFFIPGLGQIYKGNVLAGIVWLILVPVGYFLLIVPGLFLHLICIITAVSGDPYKK